MFAAPAQGPGTARFALSVGTAQALDRELERLSTELDGLPAPERPAFLHAHRDLLLQPRSAEQLLEAAAKALRSDVPQAIALAGLSIAVAQELNDGLSVALGLRAKANGLALTNQHMLAIKTFEEARENFERLEQASEVGRTWSSSIQSFLLLGHYEEAFQAAQRARTIFRQTGETGRLARLSINVANIYHRQNRMREAVAAYEDAYKQLLPLNDFEGLAVALHNVAVCRIAIDDAAGALKAYDRLRALEPVAGLPLLAAQADYNSAYLYFLRGEYTRALRLLTASREIYRKNKDDYHQALCDMDQSEIYLELGMSEEAEELASASLTRFERLGTTHEIARSEADLGIALERGGDYKRAAECFARAKQTFTDENNRVWPALLTLYEGIAAFHAGDLERAGSQARAALRMFRIEEAPGKFLSAVLLLTRVALGRNRINRARRYVRFALGKSDRLDLPTLKFEAYFLLGEAEQARGEHTAAYTAYLQARETLETLRSDLRTDQLKISLMKSRVEVYGRLAEICLQRVRCGPIDVAEAFRYLEESRSRSLRDLVASGTPVDEQPSGSVQIAEIRGELNWQYRRMEQEQLSRDGLPPETVRNLRVRVRELEGKLMEAERERENNTSSAEIGSSRPSSLAEIRRKLPPGAALIQYSSLRGRMLAFYISRERVETIPVDTEMQVERRVRLLQLQMGKLRLGKSYEGRFGRTFLEGTKSHLRAMYSTLIGPLEPLLAQKEHLIIVPAGVLHGLPFHAFYDGSQYLIDRFTVSYSPSASLYAMRVAASSPASQQSLILGVASAGTPYVEEEARAVAAELPRARVLVGPDATSEALQREGRHSRLIHIATHGVFRADNPMFSSVRLADTYVSLLDLYHLSLPAELLTLSGCGTGMNVVTAGDEQLGLARGLLFAGARALLLSLWEVDDQSTSLFMQDFYRRLMKGGTKAFALAGAMKALRLQYPHPYHWAPFKLIGTADSL